MKSTSKITILLFSLLTSTYLYSQVTITEINKIEEKVVIKPEPYDSLKNWEYHEKITDYKQYIGLQIYLPPSLSPQVHQYSSKEPFLFAEKPIIIDLDSIGIKLFKLDVNNYSRTLDTVAIYNKALTEVYCPFPYSYNNGDYGTNVNLLMTNGASIGNKYYTIIDVIYSKKLNILRDRLRFNLESKKIKTNIRKKTYIDEHEYIKYNENMLFVLRNDLNGDTIYCNDFNKFVLVPFYVKQKELFQNKKLIYDDEKNEYGRYKNEKFEGYDTRVMVKSENSKGIEEITGKAVAINQGSKWLCSEVTLMKAKVHRRTPNEEPKYEINYLLKNDKDEQIAITEIKGFIEEHHYIKREVEKKLQNQQLLAKKRQEEQIRKEINRKSLEKRRVECIDLFGQQNGELVALGKVKIGMTEYMCKYAWGNPLWSRKTTIEHVVFENWFYGLGYSLHFENGTLIRIEE